MKKITKKIFDKVTSFGFNVIENDGAVIIKNLYISEINLDINVAIGNYQIEDNSYRIDLYTSEILPVKNYEKMLEELNKINRNTIFTKFIIDENKNVRIEVHNICNVEEIEQLAVAFVQIIISDISNTYSKLMKIVWG